MFDSISFSLHKLLLEKLLLSVRILLLLTHGILPPGSKLMALGKGTSPGVIRDVGARDQLLTLKEKKSLQFTEIICWKLRQRKCCDFWVPCVFVWICQHPGTENKVNRENFGSFDPTELFLSRFKIWWRIGMYLIISTNFVVRGRWCSPKVVKFTLQIL